MDPNPTFEKNKIGLHGVKPTLKSNPMGF